MKDGKNFETTMAKEEKAFVSIMAKERKDLEITLVRDKGTLVISIKGMKVREQRPNGKKKGEGERQALRPRVLPDESSEFGAVT